MSNRLFQMDNTLHAIPERGMEEYKTAEYIRGVLDEHGIPYSPVAGTGTLVYFKGGRKDILAFRADIDALPLGDSSCHPSPSTHEGFSHACGHSGHTSALLETVLRVREEISEGREPTDSLLFIFQPGEEGFAGAKQVIEDPAFEPYKKDIRCFYATHLNPGLEEGEIAMRSGIFSAQNINIKWHITGRGCHGAQPHEGIDIVVIASELIGAYQTIRSRNINPGEMYVFTIGRLLTGSVVGEEFIPGGACNIIPNDLQMEGTIRFYDKKYIDISKERIEAINRGFQEAYGIKIEMSFEPLYPPMYNDIELYKNVEECAMKLDIPVNPAPRLTGSEDFSFFRDIAPTFMYLTGSRNDEKGHTASLHNPAFGYSHTALDPIIRLNLELIGLR